MTKKKRGHPDIEEILQRPWCYYCERDFDDLKILISHQKAKHFKCERCGRRLNTAGGLSVHLTQVHKETLTAVENANPGREDASIEIFGMEGIPDEVINAHHRQVTDAYFRQEAERRAVTGNPPPGTKGASEGGVKKPKIETAGEIKQRLAEHKARKEAEKNGLVSGGNTPGQTESSLGPPMANSPQSAPFQISFGHPQTSSSPHNFNPYQPPPQPGYPGFAVSPIQQSPFAMPPMVPMPQRHPSWGPPMGQQSPPIFPNGHPMGFPQGPSPGPYHQFPQSAYSPAGPPASAPGMSPGLPQPAPGLPQRPAFQAPNLSKEEMAKMHIGAPPPAIQHLQNGSQQLSASPVSRQEIGDSVDDLIASVTGEGGASRSLAATHPSDLHSKPRPGTPTRPEPSQSTSAAAMTTDEKKDKKSKKSKDDKLTTKLIYSDNETSPEEKRAHKSRYSFDRHAHEHTVLVRDVFSAGGATTVADDTADDTVLDSQDTHPL